MLVSFIMVTEGLMQPPEYISILYSCYLSVAGWSKDNLPRQDSSNKELLQ